MKEKEKLGQEPAFAVAAFGDGEGVCESGMSKRYYAACAAMNGILSSMPHSKENTIEWLESILKVYGNIKVGEAVAKEAFMYADELLKQENE